MALSEPCCIWDLKTELGEGPLWLAAERSVMFVDIIGRRIHRLRPDTGARESWDAPARPSLIVPVAGGGLLCGLEDGLRRFDPLRGDFGPLHPIEPMLPANRLNDGFIDLDGRLWFGTMHDAEEQPTGSLYRLTRFAPLVVPERQDGGYIVSNGPAIDPVRRRLYHNDSSQRRIFVFDLSSDGGISNKRTFATLENAYPDGLAVDAEGTLWVAMFGGGCVRRFRPDGTLNGAIEFPCSHVTKLVFGDADLRTAYVTTARKGLSAEALATQPLAGGLFRFRVDVPGLPQNLFRP